MATDIRVGKSRDHSKRKNPRANELWMAAKKVGRPKQHYVEITDQQSGEIRGGWDKTGSSYHIPTTYVDLESRQ
jgi:hypothetical protein